MNGGLWGEGGGGGGEQPCQRGTKALAAHPPHLQNFSSLSCDYFAVNQSRLLVCDLGNPMKAGASVSGAGERTGGGRGQPAQSSAVGQGRRAGAGAGAGVRPRSDLTASLPSCRSRSSGVAFGSQFLTSGTRRRRSSLTSRSSGRVLGGGRWAGDAQAAAGLGAGPVPASSSLAGLSTNSVSPSHSKNLNNSQSDVVSFRLSVEAQAQVSLNGSVPRGRGPHWEWGDF